MKRYLKNILGKWLFIQIVAIQSNQMIRELAGSNKQIKCTQQDDIINQYLKALVVNDEDSIKLFKILFKDEFDAQKIGQGADGIVWKLKDQEKEIYVQIGFNIRKEEYEIDDNSGCFKNDQNQNKKQMIEKIIEISNKDSNTNLVKIKQCNYQRYQNQDVYFQVLEKIQNINIISDDQQFKYQSLDIENKLNLLESLTKQIHSLHEQGYTLQTLSIDQIFLDEYNNIKILLQSNLSAIDSHQIILNPLNSHIDLSFQHPLKQFLNYLQDISIHNPQPDDNNFSDLDSIEQKKDSQSFSDLQDDLDLSNQLDLSKEQDLSNQLDLSKELNEEINPIILDSINLTKEQIERITRNLQEEINNNIDKENLFFFVNLKELNQSNDFFSLFQIFLYLENEVYFTKNNQKSIFCLYEKILRSEFINNNQVSELIQQLQNFQDSFEKIRKENSGSRMTFFLTHILSLMLIMQKPVRIKSFNFNKIISKKLEFFKNNFNLSDDEFKTQLFRIDVNFYYDVEEDKINQISKVEFYQDQITNLKNQETEENPVLDLSSDESDDS